MRGFTLIELMVVVALLAIVGAMALPSLNGLVEQQRATTAINSVVGAVQAARNDAAQFRGIVTLCPIAPQPNQCGDDWSRGYWSFLDRDGNAALNDNDRMLHRFPALMPGARLTWRAFRNRNNLQFTARGLTRFQNGRFEYCAPTQNLRHARVLVINVAGRTRIAFDRDGDGFTEGRHSVAIRC